MTALMLAVAMPHIFGLKLVASCAGGSLFTVLFFGIRERSTEALLGVLYGMFATFCLFWVQPWALFTCDRSVWLTRAKKHAQRTAAPIEATLPTVASGAPPAPTAAPQLAAALS